MSSVPSSPPHETGPQIHRRETLRQIVLPFIGAGLVILAILLAAALLNDPMARYRVAFIADFMFTLLVLCPAVLCMFGVYVIMVLAIYGMYRLHRGVGTPLERLERATETMSQRIETWSTAVNQRVVGLSVRFASLTALLSLFDKPEDENGKSESTANPVE